VTNFTCYHQWINKTIKPKVWWSYIYFIVQNFTIIKVAFSKSTTVHHSAYREKAIQFSSTLRRLRVRHVIPACRNLESRALGFHPRAKRSHQFWWMYADWYKSSKTHTYIHSTAFVIGKESKNGKRLLRWKLSVRFETLHTSVLNTVFHVAEMCSYTFGNSKTLLTFMGSCIVNVFLTTTNKMQRAQYSLLLSVLYMCRAVFPIIIRSTALTTIKNIVHVASCWLCLRII